MLRKVFAGMVSGLVLASGLVAQETKTVAPGTPVTIVVKPAEPATPPVSISLGARHAVATPTRTGCNHTAGGNIDIQQPSADTIVVTMTGVAVAGACPGKCSQAAIDADLSQCIEVSFDKPEVKAAKLTIEGRVIGLLRSHCKGGGIAEESASAEVCTEGGPAVSLNLPAHSASCGDNLSINDREGPCSMPVVPGKYNLHVAFHVGASHPKSIFPCKAASSEFAPDAIDPLWISAWEPFKGASKKDFGLQVTIKVAEDTPPAPEKKDDAKKSPK